MENSQHCFFALFDLLLKLKLLHIPVTATPRHASAHSSFVATLICTVRAFTEPRILLMSPSKLYAQPLEQMPFAFLKGTFSVGAAVGSTLVVAVVAVVVVADVVDLLVVVVWLVLLVVRVRDMVGTSVTVVAMVCVLGASEGASVTSPRSVSVPSTTTTSVFFFLHLFVFATHLPPCLAHCLIL